MAAQIEHLLYLGDTRRFVVIGTAGGLSADLAIGDVALITRALRDEGISHHYLAPERFVDAPGALTGDLRNALSARFDAVSERTTWTVPVPYRTTRPEVAAYAAEGVSVVEMEIASLFAVAAARGVEAAAAVVISDVVRAEGVEVEWRDTGAPLVAMLEGAVGAITTSAAGGG
jgi:uridine phosphorylase